MICTQRNFLYIGCQAGCTSWFTFENNLCRKVAIQIYQEVPGSNYSFDGNDLFILFYLFTKYNDSAS